MAEIEVAFGPDMAKSIEVYQMLVADLKERGVVFEEDSEQLHLEYDTHDSTLAYQVHTRVNCRQQRVQFALFCHFTVDAKMNNKVLHAINLINNRIPIGTFIINPSDGRIRLDYCTSFIESDLTQGQLSYYTLVLLSTISDFAVRLLAVSRGYIKPDHILKLAE